MAPASSKDMTAVPTSPWGLSIFQYQIVGIVPPSITCSLPAMKEARSETRNATSSAT